MRLIDKLAIHALVKTITNFIITVLKMFQKNDTVTKPERKRPIIDKLKNIFKEE